LLAFEIAVMEGQPGMVMRSYNKLNGDWACENSCLLTDVLKKAWGFRGFVLSDWGGTHTTTKAALAGLDNEEPGSNFFGPALKRAVESGEVPLSRLNGMVHRIVRTEFASGIVDDPPKGRAVDPFRGADTAQEIAEQSIVLLKNANSLLPLNAAAVKSIAIHRVACGYVTLPIDPKFLSIFSEQKDDWELLPGECRFCVGGSSRATPLTVAVKH
jgi:beta-glucosidase